MHLRVTAFFGLCQFNSRMSISELRFKPMPDLAAGGPVRTLLSDYDFSKFFFFSKSRFDVQSVFRSVYTSDCWFDS